MITEQDYIDAEEQYINLTDEELGQMAQQAADAQPSLFAYVATYYDFLKEDDNKEFFIQMIYSTWITYNNKYELKRKLTIDDVEKMDEAEGNRLNELYENQDALIGEVLRRMTKHPQSELIGYIYVQIGDFFGMEQLEDENSDDPSFNDAGIISGVINSFVNLLEKTRETLSIS
jgi:hypothetical protein